MSSDRASKPRRQIVKLLGGAAALAPLATLTGCSRYNPDGSATETPAPADPSADVSQPAEAPDPRRFAPSERPGPDTPRLQETDTAATNIEYVADATTVDRAAHPNYVDGQACQNCTLYLEIDGVEGWGGCGLVRYKLVKATGWCIVYAPSSS